MAANAAAWNVLVRTKGDALDAVIAGATQCEDDPSEHSVGLGGLPDASGEVSLDASVMTHEGRCGAVACLKGVAHAAQVARRVMEKTPHVLLVGPAATDFALAQGMSRANLLTDEAAQRLRQWKQKQPKDWRPIGHDTLGILAVDAAGRLAGACTTSGTAFKLPGRVGDSPIIGAGLYVDGSIGAATATGWGEEMIRLCASFNVVENLRHGMEPQAALADVLSRLLNRRAGDPGVDVSLLVLRSDGESAGMTLRRSTNFQFAVHDGGGARLVAAPAIVETA